MIHLEQRVVFLSLVKPFLGLSQRFLKFIMPSLRKSFTKCKNLFPIEPIIYLEAKYLDIEFYLEVI
mgnify:CR=1 FL=1